MTEHTVITSKVFQAHFQDADYHLEQSAKWNNELQKSTRSDRLDADQIALGKARAHGRACIVATIAGVESLCNCLVDQMAVRNPADLPPAWLSKTTRARKYVDWPLMHKLRYLPVLCCEQLQAPDYYAKGIEEEFGLFGELVKVRNSLAHGGMVLTKCDLRSDQSGKVLLIDEFDSNFWPLTRFPKDVRTLSYAEAMIVYDRSMSLAKRFLQLIGNRVTLEYLRDELLEHNGKVYSIRRESSINSDPRWCQGLLS